MSIEQLLFFVLLIAIPLLERLIRAMRGRTSGSTGERTHAPAEPTISRPGSSVSGPEVGATPSERRAAEPPMLASPLPPALPPEAPHAASEQVGAPARETRVREGRKLGSATTSLRVGHGERPRALQRLIAGADLRRAIILIAALGPCRALEPKDVSHLR